LKSLNDHYAANSSCFKSQVESRFCEVKSSRLVLIKLTLGHFSLDWTGVTFLDQGASGDSLSDANCT